MKAQLIGTKAQDRHARPRAVVALWFVGALALSVMAGCSSDTKKQVAKPAERPPAPELDERARADAERTALAFACAVRSGELERAQAWAAYLMGYNAGLAEIDIALSKEHAELFDQMGERIAGKPIDCLDADAYPGQPPNFRVDPIARSAGPAVAPANGGVAPAGADAPMPLLPDEAPEAGTEDPKSDEM